MARSVDHSLPILPHFRQRNTHSNKLLRSSAQQNWLVSPTGLRYNTRHIMTVGALFLPETPSSLIQRTGES
ncbi:hypothetical protein ACSBR1_019280 [Camellia fascicularis]